MPSDKNRRRGLIKPALAFLILGLGFLALLPGLPGPYLLSFLVFTVLFAIYAPKNLKPLISSFSSGTRRRTLGHAIKLLVVLIVVLGAGSLTVLPTINVAAPPQAELTGQSIKVLELIHDDVTLHAFVADEAIRPQVEYLLSLYSKKQPLIKTETSLSYGKTETSEDELQVARQNTVLVSSGTFRELVSPITQSAINASLIRMISPPRLVYNLMGEGEKSAVDESGRGLFLWSQYLEGKKIYIEDYFWAPGQSVPSGAAVILAGPRMPLDESKEAALKEYLQHGGKVLMLLDPMVSTLDPSFFDSFGISLPEGLLVDPDSSLAGTESVFVILKNFPAHPITLGLRQPVILPLAGAITESVPKEAAPEAPPIPLLSNVVDEGAEDAAPASEEDIKVAEDSEAPAPQEDITVAENEEAPPHTPEEVETAFQGHTWALGLSGKESFLETNLNSIRETTFQIGPPDLQGPLSVATATSLASGGRLVLVADSDLASNTYLTFAGNAAFISNMLYWLIGAEEDLSNPQNGVVLTITSFLARVFFFVPVIIWPLLILSVWAYFYWRRKKASA
jgi:hypothetical protein